MIELSTYSGLLCIYNSPSSSKLCGNIRCYGCVLIYSDNLKIISNLCKYAGDINRLNNLLILRVIASKAVNSLCPLLNSVILLLLKIDPY